MSAGIRIRPMTSEDVDGAYHTFSLALAESEEEKDDKKSYIVRERNASFARRVVLPEGADAENIWAELDKGLLKITVPVNRPEAKRIQIKAGSGQKTKQLETKKV